MKKKTTHTPPPTAKEPSTENKFVTWFYRACGRRHQVDQIVQPKANLLNKDEIWYTAFEPKTNHRHVTKITNKEGKEVIPTFVVKKVERPTFDVDRSYNGPDDEREEQDRLVLRYYPIKVTLYDPIVPSMPQAVFTALTTGENKFDIQIKILGPVGDTVEEWEVKNAKITKVSCSPMDWAKTGDAATVDVWFQSDEVTLLY